MPEGKMRSIHRYVYLFAICLLAISLPVSEFVTSVSIFILLTNWLIDFDYKSKLKYFLVDRTIPAFLLLFIVHIIWLLNTDNINYALNDIRIKLPLLALPVIIGTTRKLNTKELLIVFYSFITGLIISTVAGMLAYLNFIDVDIEDFRNISIFISHIRLALMLCLAVYIMILLLNKNIIVTNKFKFLFYLLIAWFIFFLFIIQSFTGFTILLILGFAFTIIKIIHEKNATQKKLYLIILISLPVVLVAYLVFFINDFYSPTEFDQSANKYTKLGNAYYNNYDSELIENGNYIYRDISEKELYSAWSERSSVSLDSITESNEKLLHTLIRYLASRGLKKDTEGISLLNDNDIRAIEKGATNYRFIKDKIILKRLYSIIWQIDVYLKGGNPSGHSITQRIEYLKAGYILIYENFWFGTGTGDVDDAFKSHYIEINSKLHPFYRHRAHNQYLTFFISFGVFGAFLCFFAIFYPFFIRRKYRDYFFVVFFSIALISMLNEDTLETTTGAIFIAFFYSLFMWGHDFGESNMLEKE